MANALKDILDVHQVSKTFNAVLGDLNVTLAGGKTTVVKIENPSRFEKADGSLDVEFSAGFGGTVYAFGKKQVWAKNT